MQIIIPHHFAGTVEIAYGEPWALHDDDSHLHLSGKFPETSVCQKERVHTTNVCHVEGMMEPCEEDLIMANKKIIFIMQHPLTPEQLAAAGEIGEIVELAKPANILNVPEDPTLGRDWFVTRAEQVLAATGIVVEPGDVVHAMGQQQLAMAINAAARRAGATLIESVTRRESVEEKQEDGSVKKTNVFRFAGFREVHEY